MSVKEVALITGSTGGIGFETARGMAARDFTTIIVGRNGRRGREAEKMLRQISGHERVFFFPADLSSQKEIQTLAEQVTRRFDHLDVLINNVGALVKEPRKTVDGHEWMLAVNHLNPFLLTQLLLPQLTAGVPGRVINVTSNVHRMARLDFEGIKEGRGFRGSQMYGQAKLLNLLTAYELGRRLTGSGVTVNIADPGGAETEMSRHGMGFLARAMTLMGVTTERAARSSIFLATESEFGQESGVYLKPTLKRGKSSKDSYDPGLARQAWRLTEELLERSFDLPISEAKRV
ncbi:MAG: SDR family NAD(P)-dependent oxidoreductase [Ardenticatenaceae bacterium]|nr:SDR family NAD(P)-dependent oxidoreductase [Ardenticatenaceae bacterium]